MGKSKANPKRYQAWKAKRDARRGLQAHPVVQWARAHPEEALRMADVNHAGPDEILPRILQARGDWGKAPQVLSRVGIDDLITEGGREWFHGFATKEGRAFAAQFMRGDFVPFRGHYGAGFYTGIGLAGRSEAYQYTGVSRGGQATPGSVVMRGALLPTARVYTEAAINREFARDRAVYQKAHPNPRTWTPAEKAVYEVAYGDLGWYAGLRGYDAIGEKGWGLILNPGATAVQRSLINEPRDFRTLYRNSLNVAIGKRLGEESRAHGGKLSTARSRQIRQEEEAKMASAEQARIDRMRAARARRARKAQPQQ